MWKHETKTHNTNTSEEVVKPAAFLLDLTRILLLVLIIIVPVRLFIGEPYIVSGNSMLPNYHDKEYLIIDKLSYRSRDPKRGEVIVFRYPKNTKEFFIKRVIGLPGEKVQIDQGRVTIFNKENPDGFRLEESFLPPGTMTFGRSDIVTLGEDEFYVLGDNRSASSDSRYWGVLPRHDFVGKVWVRIYPFNVFGKISEPSI